MKLAFVFPGQGSQTVGMMDGFSAHPVVRATFDEASAALGDDLWKLVAEGPSAEEVNSAKRYLAGVFPLGLQAPDDLASQLADVELYGLDPRYLESYADRIEAVTVEECRRALKAHVCVDNLKIVVVSNPEPAIEALQGLGPIEARDIP